MNEKIRGIVLGTVRHNDRHNIVTFFTRERGRMGFLNPVGTGKSARLKNARLQPLALVDADVRIVPSKDLVLLSRFSSPYVWKSIYFNPTKQAIVLFLQEFLNKLLRSSAPDEALFDYITRAINVLDLAQPERVANLHIAFMIGLLKPIGIFPNLEDWEEGDWFDMRGGEFTAERPLHNDWLSPADSKFLPLLSRMTMSNAYRFRFTSENRRQLLNQLIRYYSIHFPGIGQLNSLDVLTEVYHR